MTDILGSHHASRRFPTPIDVINRPACHADCRPANTQPLDGNQNNLIHNRRDPRENKEALELITRI
jgi:hypothetical protein